MLSNELKKRFVKDFNIPIKLFDEPYFSERMELLNNKYNCLELFDLFKKTLSSYENEKEFFDEFNKICDEMVAYVVSKEKYQEINTCDMNPFAIKVNVPNKTIFTGANVGKHLISIDMKKANFSTLKYLGVLSEFDTYEDFIRKFTDKEYFIKSKKIREVIFGKMNPNRVGTYEKYLMKFLYDLLAQKGLEDNIVFYSNDEILVEITNENDVENVREKVKSSVEELKNVVPFHIEEYVLKRVYPLSSYVKVFMDGTYEIKATNSMYIPLVTRFMENEEPRESDLVFEYEGEKVKFLDIKKLSLLDKMP